MRPMKVSMRKLLSVASVLAGIVALGCDDRRTVPASVLEQAKKEEQQHKGPKAPTTQELLTGPRKRVELMPLPVTIEMPVSWGRWNEKNPAGIKLDANLLQGYTPNGEVQIQLSSRPSMKQDDLDRIMDAGKKEMAAKPMQILKLDLRPLGSVKMLERQSVGLPQPLTTYNPDGTAHTSVESNFNWTLSVLVPTEGAYSVYEINFIGLTKNQYEKDKDFLHGITDTLRYEGDAAATTTAPATSVPAKLQ
jgi:hypothetical protein